MTESEKKRFLDYMLGLDGPDRFKAFVKMTNEDDDETLREKMRIVIKDIGLLVTKELYDSCGGSSEKFIEMMIANRKKQREMNDVAYCNNKDCPLKDNCWRYIEGMNAKGDNWWFSGEWDGKMCRCYMGN